MKKIKYFLMTLLVACALGTVVSCSDEPDTSNYYTFTGEMMNDYLESHSEFSEFAAIVKRAGMMELLSAYGHYTCFPPTNEAFAAYYKKRGISSIDQLTDADCDTIARTHLVGNMYATSEMNDGVLTTANMNRRYIEVSHDLDNDSNAVVFLNRTAHIIFTMQDDSVENGIMQPITEVLESSNSMLPDVMKTNPRISLFYSALVETRLVDSLYKFRDDTYNAKDYPRYKYTSHVNKETATVPDEKKYGFTAFVPTDSVLNALYGITNLRQLYDKACEIYDAVYPEDVNTEAHNFENLTDRKNPLNRFIAYHILHILKNTVIFREFSQSANIALEVAAVYPLGKEILFEHRNSAGIKPDPLRIPWHQRVRKQHISYAERRRDCVRECVDVDDIAAVRHSEKCSGSTSGKRKLGIVVVLDYYRAVFHCPL